MNGSGAPVALVSGGSRGLGLAITERLLADGWSVGAFSRSSSSAVTRAEETWPDQFVWYQADVVKDDMRGIVRRIADRTGPVDALVARPHLARPLLRDLLHDLPLSHDLPGSARTLPCPLHVLWSDDDPLTRDDRIGHWALASRATVTFHRFTGDHFFLGTGAHRAIPIVQDALRASHHGGDSSEDAAQQPGKALLEHGRAQ